MLYPGTLAACPPSKSSSLQGCPCCTKLTSIPSWTCATPRQHPEVEQTVKTFDGKTWEQLYQRAEHLIDTSEDVLDDSIRQQLVLEILRENFSDRGVKPLPLAAQKVPGKNLIKWSSTSTVLEKINEHRQHHFHLLDQHICERLEFKTVDGVPKVKYAIVKNLAKPTPDDDPQDRIKIKAKYVVICGGPILTPQLLYNSGFRPEFKDADEGDPAREDFLELPALVSPVLVNRQQDEPKEC